MNSTEQFGVLSEHSISSVSFYQIVKTKHRLFVYRTQSQHYICLCDSNSQLRRTATVANPLPLSILHLVSVTQSKREEAQNQFNLTELRQTEANL